MSAEERLDSLQQDAQMFYAHSRSKIHQKHSPIKGHANILFFVAFVKEPNLVQGRAHSVSFAQIRTKLAFRFGLL